MPLLTEEQIHQALAALPGWEYRAREIRKTYTAPTFHRAIGFVVQMGMLADAADHHPAIDIRYATVTVALSTHSAGGVTEKDIRMAAAIEGAFGS